MLGLDIAPANQGLVVLEKVLYGQPGFQFRLKNGLDSMGRGYYDFILIDCPSSFGTLTLNALAAADVLMRSLSIASRIVRGVESQSRSMNFPSRPWRAPR